jgi:hypothetical protein
VHAVLEGNCHKKILEIGGHRTIFRGNAMAIDAHKMFAILDV